MSSWKLRFGLGGIDLSLSIILFLLLVVFGSSLLSSVLEVRTEVSAFENIAEKEFDPNDPEDLSALDATLSNTGDLKNATNNFAFILIGMFLMFMFLASFIKAGEYRLLVKKSNYWKLLLKIFLIHFGILIFAILYIMVAISLTSYLGFYEANAMNISLLLGLIFFSYLLFGAYTYITKNKLDLLKFLKLHSFFIFVCLLYYLIAEFLIGTVNLLVFKSDLLWLYVIILLVWLYVGHFIIVTEQDLLLK